MFDYSPINTYPCTPPGVATNIKKKDSHFNYVILLFTHLAEGL